MNIEERREQNLLSPEQYEMLSKELTYAFKLAAAMSQVNDVPTKIRCLEVVCTAANALMSLNDRKPHREP